jgi:hypothetical protein
MPGKSSRESNGRIGFSVTGAEHRWLKTESERVAKLEHLTHASIKLLIHRMIEGDLDMSVMGISRYQGIRSLKTKARRAKAHPKIAHAGDQITNPFAPKTRGH